MRITCIICSLILVMGGAFALFYALSTVNILWFVCFQNAIIYRIFLGLQGVSAAWLLFWIALFRPQNNLH